MVKKNKDKWVLIFWIESCEISIVSLKDISEVLKSKLIRVGWCGDLPWVDRYGITTLYEAKLLKISRNFNYLEALLIDVKGKVLKKNYSVSIMAEKKKLSGNKKKNAKLQEKNVQSMNESTKELVKIGKPLSNNSPQINRPITTTDNDLIQVDDSTKSTTSSETSQTQKNTCENCKDCICRPWRSNLTPEYTTLFGLQANSFNKYISKKNLTASQKLKIELHPNTGIFISENEINLALSKSNYKHRKLVRQLLSLIITNEELIAFKTAENMNKNNPNIRNAIIGYLKSECDVSLTIVEFNDIVRRKIDQAVINQKPLDEIQK
ncbi:uncharacterized protein LOC141537170 [Cotesia typhae]|uniref:uncharacterized protein LOC141537170 n=1 Tax=Cotesia typhae TaxID=2053667 RepID=UPI003D68260E